METLKFNSVSDLSDYSIKLVNSLINYIYLIYSIFFPKWTQVIAVAFSLI